MAGSQPLDSSCDKSLQTVRLLLAVQPKSGSLFGGTWRSFFCSSPFCISEGSLKEDSLMLMVLFNLNLRINHLLCVTHPVINLK